MGARFFMAGIGEKRGLGTFDTKAQAVLANEAARSFLLATKGAVLSAEEIQANVQAARDVAFAAVAKQTTKPKRISVKSKIGDCGRVEEILVEPLFMAGTCTLFPVLLVVQLPPHRRIISPLSLDSNSSLTFHRCGMRMSNKTMQ